MTLSKVHTATAQLNGEQEKKVVSSVWGEKGRVIPSQCRSNRLGEKKKGNQDGREDIEAESETGERERVQRRGISEFSQGEKWENWSITPSWILSIYDQTERQIEENRAFVLSSCLCLSLPLFVTLWSLRVRLLSLAFWAKSFLCCFSALSWYMSHLSPGKKELRDSKQKHQRALKVHIW